MKFNIRVMVVDSFNPYSASFKEEILDFESIDDAKIKLRTRFELDLTAEEAYYVEDIVEDYEERKRKTYADFYFGDNPYGVKDVDWFYRENGRSYPIMGVDILSSSSSMAFKSNVETWHVVY